MREPQVVRTPRVQKMSLWAIGTPVRARPAPPASARSAAAAAASAASAVTEMKALSAPWCCSMRARYARTSSTLEKARARSPAASCVSVLVCRSLTRASLDDLGHQVQAGGDLRSVLLVLLVSVLLGHGVRPQALRQARQRMRHGRDAGGVDAIQRPDEIEYPRQAVLVYRDLGG